MQRNTSMHYVMEVGPLQDDIWLLFTVDENRQVHLAASGSRDFARRDMVSHLAGKPAECCDSLREFGARYDWKLTYPTPVVKEIAAALAIGVEISRSFGGMMPPTPMIDAWLRSVVMFLMERPLSVLRDALLEAHFDGPFTERRLITALGPVGQTALLISANGATKLDDIPDDGLVFSILHSACAASEAVREHYGIPFTVRVLRMRGGKVVEADDRDLDVIMGSLLAIASLCIPGRDVGRGTANGVETIVMRKQAMTNALGN